MNNAYFKDLSQVDWMARLEILFKNVSAPFIEVFHGIQSKTIPWIEPLSIALFLQFMILIRADKLLFLRLHIIKLYPKGTFFFFYYFLVVGIGFWVWGIMRAGEKRRLALKMESVFTAAGLQNNLGRTPTLVFDVPLDQTIRKLRVTRAVLPMQKFEEKKGHLNGELRIYIDEIRENREEGTVDFIYSRTKMAETFSMPDIKSVGKAKFLVGTTRSKTISTDLDSCPHLLVAGQTGKGKSTFLRQFITSLYMNDRSAEFTLIDLKGGLEFQLFERLKRVEVPPTIKKALAAIEKLSITVDSRMELLKSSHCKDISAYLAQLSNSQNSAEYNKSQQQLNRHIVVIDEAAEMFLAGSHATAKDIQAAKRILSKIARQGRSLGVHLVIATQRPDTKALDPQVKANLSGVICFQMGNDASSMTVLGNGRATDLPATPGRAIWKMGGEMVEVQTPLLTTNDVERILEHEYQGPQVSASVPIPEQLPSGIDISDREKPVGTNAKANS